MKLSRFGGLPREDRPLRCMTCGSMEIIGSDEIAEEDLHAAMKAEPNANS